MAVTIKKDNVGKMLAAVKRLTGKRVLVGVPATAAERRQDRDGKEPVNNAMIGYLNEFGSPAQNIPPRPHLVPGVRDAEKQIAKGFQSAGQAALSGDFDKVDAGLVFAGEAAVASVRKHIADVIPPPLSKRTLDARARKGRASETPLIDTGAYNQSIRHVIRDKK